MEDVAKWHHGVPSDEEYAAAHRGARRGAGRRLAEACTVSAPAPSMFTPPPRRRRRSGSASHMGRPNLEVFADTLLELAKADRNVLAVTSDSRGSGKLGPFAQALPEQIVEVGIAEQNLVGMAAGLAVGGQDGLRRLARVLPHRPRRWSRSRTTSPTPTSR